MRLDPEIAASVTQTLGEPLPHPESDAFRELLKRLDQSDPALAELLRSALIFSQGGDLETQARREGRREKRRRTLVRMLFWRYDDLDDAYHPSKAKLLALFSVIGLGGMGALFFGAPLLRRPPEPASESVVGTLIPDANPAPTARPVQDADPFGGVAEEVARNERAQDALAGAARGPSQAPPDSGTPIPAAGNRAAASGGGVQAADEPAPGPDATSAAVVEETTATAAYDDPLLPSTEGEAELGLAVYTRTVGGAPEPGLRAFGGAAAGGRPAGADDPFAAPEPGAATGTVGLAAYRRAEPEAESPGGLAVYKATQTAAGRLSVFRGRRPAPPEARLVSRAVAGPPPRPAASPEPVGAAPYAAGESLRATLQLGIVATPDTPLPVLARADDGSVWQGLATLRPTGRVELRFTTVSVASRRYAVSAVGGAEDGFSGLPASVSEATPALASDLARGALRGLSEHVQALGQETEVRVEGGVPVVNQSAPSLEASVAGSVARLFTPPEGEDQQALVRLAQVSAGTPFRIVVLADAGAAVTP